MLGKSSDASSALAEAFFKAMPATQKKKVSEAQWAASLQKFHQEAKQISLRFSLGPLSRALAAYHFQKRLLQAGFDADVVRKVVFSLVLNSFVGKP